MIERNDMAKAARISAEELDLLDLLLEDEGIGLTRTQQILATDGRDDLPLSFAQQRLWFLDQLEPGSATYNIPAAVRLTGALNVAALERTLDEVVRRHEVLRTVFISEAGQPRQLVREHTAQALEVTDLSHLPQVEREVEAHLRASEEAQRPFDLGRGPLLRTSLLKLGTEEHVLLLTMHHIVSDGWSAGVLVREMGALYAAYAQGGESPLEELAIQYGDYARWQREWLQGEVLEEQLGYWREQLAGAPPVLELPTDRPRPAVQTFRGARLPFALSPELSEALRVLGRREGATLFMTLLAAFDVLLSRYTGQDDIVVGTPIAGRTRAEVEGLIGFFVNTLVVRAQVDAESSFREVLGRVKEACLGAYAHQDVPFEKLVEELHPERSLTHTPLFQVCFVLQNNSIPNLNFEGLTLTPSTDTESVTAKFDLTLVLSDREGALTGAVEWRTDLFDADTVRRMLGHFEKLLQGIAEAPDCPISQLALLSEEERFRLLYDWNEIEADYSSPSCIHELFERQAATQPEAIAVVYEDERLTYAELNGRAERLAQHLRSLGVGPESRVALLMERSVEMVSALLGVLKAGAAYVPLDPAYPQERLSFMLEDSGADVLLTHEGLADSLPHDTLRAVDVGEVWSANRSDDVAGDAGGEDVARRVSADNLAYVIYTSGSTGKPKGVMITHAKVYRLLAATRRWFGFDQSDVWTLFHSYAFDFSVWEMWGALCHGGRLEVVPYWMSRSPEEFRQLLAAKRVTVLNQTPSAFRQLAAVESARQLAASKTAAAHPSAVNDTSEVNRVEDELSLRFVIFGGEALDARWADGWLGRPSAPALINMYGITETTVHVTYRPVEESDVAAGAGGVIGRRIPDLQVYVLDGRMEPMPTGVAGELYVGGAGLARGYLNRPELTAERFVPHPFSTEPGGRLYRTGDVGRYRADGELEYLGRADQQVKVRGFRIELGEIEATLSAHPQVRETVVVALASEAGGGDKRLVAYVVGEAGGAPRAGELREYLLSRLPDYMVPSAFVLLDALPLTPNGKVDRRALPAPEQAATATDRTYVAPRTPVEEILCGIWSEVLGAERVGVTDNFFELGGDSIRSVRVLALAKEKNLQFSLQQLFQHQTIGALCDVLGRSEAHDAPDTGSAPFSLISEADRALLPAHVEDAYPLAKMQAGMLFHMELMPESALYHNVNSWPLRAPFDHAALDEAVRKVVARHAILRTSFELGTYSEPLQLVHSEAVLPVGADDLRHLSPAEQEEVVAAYVTGEKQRRFDMTQPPLLRFHVHRLTDETFQFTLTEFHPILDGWSLQSTLTEIFTKYFAQLNGQPVPDEPQPLTTYRDFVRLERETLASAEAGQFWEEHLRGAEPVLMPRWPEAFRGTPAARMRRQRIRIPADVFDGLQSTARRAGVPLKSVLLAAHLKVMNLLSGRTDVLTGLVSNGRLEESGGEQVRGLFLNTLPFRLDLARATWLELAQNAFAGEREMLPFRRYPLAVLQEKREPLFETLFNYVHFHVLEGVLGAGRIEAADAAGHASEETNFTVDASFSLSPLASQLTLTLDCDATQLSDEQIDAIGNYYRNVCHSMAVEPTARHDARILLTSAEQELFAGWNETARDYDLGRCVHELFEAQAARTPDAEAVVFEAESLTYGELNERANRLARRLRELGAGPERRVGLCVERSTRMLVGLLATLKAGAAYVPLDPAYPAERLAYMIEDAGIGLLLTDQEQAAQLRLTASGPLFIDIESVASEPREDERGNLGVTVEPENAAYVIYTSGSTGQPKGVLISQRSLSNYTQAAVEEFGLKPCDRVLQFASISFDTAAEEIFPCLAAGATLVLRDGNMLDSSQTFLEKTLAHRITVLDLPTAYWHHLTIDLSARNLALPAQLRLVIIGGEEAQPERLAEWRSIAAGAGGGGGGVRLVNTYGPTETTIVATACDLSTASEAEGSRPRTDIGSPVSNAEAYVLDAQLQTVPVGVAGELYIGGAGVARGYLNHPDLTAQKFIPHPFGGKVGARLYRTGDLVRRLPNGMIEFLGRADYQVKIRGFRIEPGEVEAALTKHPSVGEAAVIARDDAAGEKRLVAYLVAKPGLETAPAGQLREYLKEQLPAYMVPSAFVLLDALPLTPNGKVDRRALPAPEAPTGTPDSGYVAPRTPTEEVLCGIWTEVLGTARVGIDDDFFELGGHSLLATQVVSRVREALQVEVPLRALFEASRPRQLAARVDALLRGGTSAVAPPLVKVMSGGDAPLSFAQQRLWFLDQLEPGSATYNIPAAVRLTGALNVAALERTLDEVVRRHEVLRTVFVSEAGQPRQLVREHTAQALEVTDLSHLPQVEREVEARLRASEEAQRPFDLGRGPLLRTSLLKLGGEEYVLLLTMHHIVSDGWSAGVLVREMGALYAAYAQGNESPLEELTIQYGDYARWQREWLQGEVLEEQLGYWREQLAGAPPVLELPTDRPRPPSPTLRGGRELFTIAEGTAEALRALGRREGATLFMTLLAAFDVLLSRYTGQGDIVVGTPIAGRTRAEVEGLIGFFVNTLVVRARVDAESSFREVLGKVKEACLGAYAHQDVPFEKLVEELHPERSLTHTPLFQVMFSFQVAGAERLRLAGLELEGVGTEAEASKFDLTLWITEGERGLNASIEYNTDLFDAATIGRMAGHLRVLLDAAATDPDRRVSDLPLLTEREQQQFTLWNDTAAAYPSDLCVHELFERQAALRPEAVAVVHADERLTYAELNEQAERVAQHLRSLGVGPESRVGILLERSSRVVSALLGVWKAGGAYVPLDPAYPQERLSFMLEDSGAEVLLTQPELMNVLPHVAARIVDVGEVWSGVADDKEAATARKEDVARRVSADNLAYIIYTSGSTGRPKGVAISHRSCVAFIHWAHATFDPRDVAVVLASTSICFDLSVFELFVPLSLGTRIVLADDALALPTLAARDEVTLVNTVPSAMAALVESGGVPPGVRAVNLAGEALQRELVERVYGQGTVERVMNLYGPTEDTTYSTGTLVERGGGMVSIGRPIANTRAYVLDRQMRAVPVGVAGEIYLGGAGLARGYLNRPELTAERFVPHPFSTEPGGRLYRTGDVARYLPNGEIEYLGRADQQVKVRGFRIELGEIEAALLQHEGVRQAVVNVDLDARGDKRLVAYVVAETAEDASALTRELREHLLRQLPDYMVPSVFVMLDALPLTPNGKVDRRALPAPDAGRDALSAGYVAPRSAAEQVMAELWSEVLGVERVGVQDNFFELGGHSLLATQVVSRTREALQCEVPLRKLFELPTVAGLVEHVAQQLGGVEVAEEVARTYNELKNLSEEEVRKLLA
jgi:amino acid adenylation domain-containing protein